MLKKIDLNVTNTDLELLVNNKKTVLSFEWLRENCRCTSCFNEVTNQRNICIFSISPDIRPTSYSLSENTLDICWDDGHKSQYLFEWLIAQNKIEESPPEVLWSGDISNHLEYVTATDVKSRNGITLLIKSLLEYGVGFVTNVNPDIKSTEEVIQCVGPPQQTLFGGMWEFSDKMDHFDTAYTNQALDAHTDTSYFIEPAGLIIFHCTKRSCSGGKTLLVDGFRAAKDIKNQMPELYQCLRSVSTEFHYIEKGHHFTCLTPMIHHAPNDKIKQLRYNMYDRSAKLPFPSSKSSLFYKSVRQLAGAVNKPDGQWWLTLQPGTVVFINNWRVLHGRSSYTGHRTITGAYISMGNLLSRARCLGLIR